MKKGLLCAVSVLLMLALLSLSSCGVLADLGAGGDETVKGKYEAINGSPRVQIEFSAFGVSVSVGSKSMDGKYELIRLEDGTARIVFDFGEKTLPRCQVQTGNYPVSFGRQGDVDYMMLFGARYNKLA